MHCPKKYVGPAIMWKLQIDFIFYYYFKTFLKSQMYLNMHFIHSLKRPSDLGMCDKYSHKVETNDDDLT